jgi:tetratricopeptide (TPR) repeat protein
MKLKQPSLVSQGTLSRMLQAAEQAWQQKDFEQNIELLERARHLAPANSKILWQLGRVQGLRYNYAAAEECFDRAIRLAPNKTEALANAGQWSLDFASHQLTEHYFQQALEQKDAKAEIFARLAELYERLHKLEDASRLINRALQLDVACPLALLARARLDRQAGRLEEAEQLLRAFPASTDLEARIRCHYELGAVLDRQKRYDDAMTAFLEAKALLGPDLQLFSDHLRNVRARRKQMEAGCSREMFQRWWDPEQAPHPRRKLALLCGHPRSGTTLLEQVLDSHPDIVSVDEREVFRDDVYAPLIRALPADTPMLPALEATRPDKLSPLRENYFRYMGLCLGNPIGDRLLIDKNPSYLFFIPAFIRVFPETKFLIALRDPRDVCLSCFMLPHYTKSQGTAEYASLDSVTDNYSSLMSIWRTLAPLIQDHSLEVRYEEMVEDLETVSRRVLDFLGVTWDEKVLRFNERVRTNVMRAPTYAEVAKPIFKTAVGRWQNYQKYLEPHLGKLEPFIKAFGYE